MLLLSHFVLTLNCCEILMHAHLAKQHACMRLSSPPPPPAPSAHFSMRRSLRRQWMLAPLICSPLPTRRARYIKHYVQSHRNILQMTILSGVNALSRLPVHVFRN
jgi:hypothetical protein